MCAPADEVSSIRNGKKIWYINENNGDLVCGCVCLFSNLFTLNMKWMLYTFRVMCCCVLSSFASQFALSLPCCRHLFIFIQFAVRKPFLLLFLFECFTSVYWIGFALCRLHLSNLPAMGMRNEDWEVDGLDLFICHLISLRMIHHGRIGESKSSGLCESNRENILQRKSVAKLRVKNCEMISIKCMSVVYLWPISKFTYFWPISMKIKQTLIE